MTREPEDHRVFQTNFAVYGPRKLWRQLKREGHHVARCTVARLMQTLGLQGVIRGKPVRTTISDKATPCPLDHVNRQFKAARPNALWLSDFTYVATWAGFVYVAFVIDAYAGGAYHEQRTRASCSTRWNRLCMTGGLCIAAGLCITATEAANTSRSNTPIAWPKPASNLRWAASATATTMLWPINGLYKAEVIHRRGPWRSFDAVEFATLEWVDWFNNRRLLEPIGNIPPVEAEKHYYAMLDQTAMAA